MNISELNPYLNAALLAREEYFNSLSEDEKAKALEFQNKIDAVLAKAGSNDNRFMLISQMMFDSSDRLVKKLQQVAEDLAELQKEIKAVKNTFPEIGL